MRLLLSAIFVCLPLTVWAETFQGPAPSTPVPPIIDDIESTELFGNPYGPASATNFEALRPLSFREGSRLHTTAHEPDWLDHPFGRYGNPYFPDPMNHRYDDGRAHLPGSPIDLPNRDVR
jgi:hypothetical protein